jgi:hypothetical protein
MTWSSIRIRPTPSGQKSCLQKNGEQRREAKIQHSGNVAGNLISREKNNDENGIGGVQNGKAATLQKCGRTCHDLGKLIPQSMISKLGVMAMDKYVRSKTFPENQQDKTQSASFEVPLS